MTSFWDAVAGSCAVATVRAISGKLVVGCGDLNSRAVRSNSRQVDYLSDSPLGLDKWLPAVWMIVNAKNGVSSVSWLAAWHHPEVSLA